MCDTKHWQNRRFTFIAALHTSWLINKAKRTYVITLIGIWLAAENIGSNSFVRDATSVRNSKCRRLRSVFWLLSWQPTTLNLSILLLCIHENRRRFESQNGSHMALFSAPMCSCCQRITRHNANYAQMPGCPLCSIKTVCTNNSRRLYTNVVTRVCGSVGRLNPTTVVNDENSHFETLPQWRRPTLRPKQYSEYWPQRVRSVTPHTLNFVRDGIIPGTCRLALIPANLGMVPA